MDGPLHVVVKEAAGLKDTDRGKSMSDPYVLVEVAGQKSKTKTVKNDLSPRWEESFQFASAGAHDILFKVYDDDMLKDDFLGEARVPISQVPFQGWLPLKSKAGGPGGSLLVAINGSSHGSPHTYECL